MLWNELMMIYDDIRKKFLQNRKNVVHFIFIVLKIKNSGKFGGMLKGMLKTAHQ